MMKAVVIGKYKKNLAFFSCDSELFVCENISDIRKLKADATTVFYIDRSSLSKDAFVALVKAVASRKLIWGMLDPKDQIEDPATLFFTGASDYVPGSVLEQGIQETRIKQALNYANDLPVVAEEFPKFPGWDKLVPREEYPFIFLIIALNLSEENRKSLGEKRTEHIKRFFINYLMHTIQDVGKIWMSDGNYALILFPPELSVFALRTAMQMIMNAIPLAHEYYKIPQVLPAVFALHEGLAPWEKAGKTGDIISENINFIHHVVKKIAKPNCILATKEFIDLLPEKLQSIFTKDKIFEGHEMYKSMRYLTKAKKENN